MWQKYQKYFIKWSNRKGLFQTSVLLPFEETLEDTKYMHVCLQKILLMNENRLTFEKNNQWEKAQERVCTYSFGLGALEFFRVHLSDVIPLSFYFVQMPHYILNWTPEPTAISNL